MPFVWSLQIDSDTQAICSRNGVILHALPISDHPLEPKEAHAQAKILIKMRALKDVLNPEWSDIEAAQYAVANRIWLDNKFLDAARKRWGSAHYLTERWLLLGAYDTNAIEELAQELDADHALEALRTTLQNKDIASAFNSVALQGPKIGQLHGLYVDGQYRAVSGVWLQDHRTEDYHIAIVLSDDGEWHVLMVDIKKPARAQCITLQEPPATLDLQPFFPNLSPAALDEALRMA